MFAKNLNPTFQGKLVITMSKREENLPHSRKIKISDCLRKRANELKECVLDRTGELVREAEKESRGGESKLRECQKQTKYRNSRFFSSKLLKIEFFTPFSVHSLPP